MNSKNCLDRSTLINIFNRLDYDEMLKVLKSFPKIKYIEDNEDEEIPNSGSFYLNGVELGYLDTSDVTSAISSDDEFIIISQHHNKELNVNETKIFSLSELLANLVLVGDYEISLEKIIFKYIT